MAVSDRITIPSDLFSHLVGDHRFRANDTNQSRPSCKRSGKRWVYSAMAPNIQVLNKLFKIDNEEGEEMWTTKKIPLGDFERITGKLTARVSVFFSNITFDDSWIMNGKAKC